MKLGDLGFNKVLEKHRQEQNLDGFEAGRIIAEHKERYVVRTEKGDFDGEITGNMRYTAKSREDFPAVGDWVALTIYDKYAAVINEIFPRASIIKRQAVGQFGEVQIIATNIDFAFIMQAVDRDFSLNRLERYLTICNAGKVDPIIVLNKIDLISEQEISDLVKLVKNRVQNVPIIALSNETKNGYSEITKFIAKGKTYCIMGSSGVGKSTLVNNLLGKNIMRTDKISESSDRGRHVTSHRELFVLDNGAILIDTPGMRELGIADHSGGLEMTFDLILKLSENCRYKDCTHKHEADCAVIEAVENGELDKDFYDNYLKIEKEKEHFESTLAEKRKKNSGKY